jgi:hypothetical protein
MRPERVLTELDNGENYMMRNFVICLPHEVVIPVVKSRRVTVGGMWHVWGRGEGPLVRKHDAKRPFRISKRRWEDNIKMDLNERSWTGLTSRSIATSCVLL